MGCFPIRDIGLGSRLVNFTDIFSAEFILFGFFAGKDAFGSRDNGNPEAVSDASDSIAANIDALAGFADPSKFKGFAIIPENNGEFPHFIARRLFRALEKTFLDEHVGNRSNHAR